MKWLLVLVPIAIALEHFAPGNDLLVFAVAAGGVVGDGFGVSSKSPP